jgi:hypothetical protein
MKKKFYLGNYYILSKQYSYINIKHHIQMIITENSTFIKVIKFDLVQNSSHELDYLIKIICIYLKFYHFNIFLIKMIYF